MAIILLLYFVMLGSGTLTSFLYMEELRDIRNTNIFSAMGCCSQGSEKTASKAAIFGCKKCGFKLITTMNYPLTGMVFHLKLAY